MAELPIDYDGIQKSAQKMYDSAMADFTKFGIPRVFAVPPAASIYGGTWIWLMALVYGLNTLVKAGAWFAAAILETIGYVRQNNATSFNEVIAASLSELLGVEIPAEQLPGGKGPEGLNERVEAIGHALHNLLRTEFQTDGPITPEEGKTNAEKFSGFGINFATGSAFISILTEASSLGFLKEFRELGEQTAQAIGLGRLQRLALQPLIRNAIQVPYDYWFRSRLRPDRLTEAQVVLAVRSGAMTEDVARQQLAEKGYPDDAIQILLDQLTTKISSSELDKLIRYSVIDEQKALDILTNQGWDADHAKLLLHSADAGRADSQLGTVISNLISARLDGFIPQEQFIASLNDLPIGKEETDMILKRLSLELERPRATITFAELKSGVVQGIVDFDYVDTWLQRKGYSDQDNLILTYEIIQALSVAEAKAKAKAKTTAKLQSKGQTVPAALTSA